MAETESRWHRFWTRFRAAISFAADLWDAVKLAALFGALAIAGVVGAVLFAVTVIPPGFLVMILTGVVGLGFVFLQPVMRKLLPTPPPPPVRPAPQQQPQTDPNTRARQLERTAAARKQEEARRDRQLASRRAARRVRDELLDYRQDLTRVIEDLDAGVKPSDDFWRHTGHASIWGSEEKVLLDLDDARPHEAAREAYRQLGAVDAARRNPDEQGFYVFDPRSDFPLEADLATALDAIDAAVKALRSVEAQS